MALVPLEEAQRRVLAGCLPLHPRAVPLDDASMADAIRRCVSVRFPPTGPSGMPEIKIATPPCPVAWEVQVTTPGQAAATTG